MIKFLIYFNKPYHQGTRTNKARLLKVEGVKYSRKDKTHIAEVTGQEGIDNLVMNLEKEFDFSLDIQITSKPLTLFITILD